MTDLIASSKLTVVIGLGQTGLSVAKHLESKQQKFMMLDTRQAPPNAEIFQQRFPKVVCEFGPLKTDTLCRASQIIVSPGVDIKEPAVHAAINAGVPVVGDVQVFVDAIDTPVIAITGSNGKSTVTTLVGEMLKRAGKATAVAGNIGKPVLDLLTEEEDFEVAVLELSSFQLETTPALNAEVATVLNMSEDHMDRYPNMQAYHRAKQQIFKGAKQAVVNRQDALTQPPVHNSLKVVSFGLDKPDLKQFGVVTEQGERYLAFGLQRLMKVRDLKIRGSHNIANALAGLAVGHCLGLEFDGMLSTLKSFRGLPHRCQWIKELNGVEYFNDSKGTNVGATVAAIEGLSDRGQKIVLIAGGEGKGADFSLLTPVFNQHLRTLIAIGRDAQQLIAISEEANIKAIRAETLQEAVVGASKTAKSGDIVLLSPACASFDMFASYIERGEKFVQAVEALAA